MATIWLTSDTHFGHKKLVDTFTREGGGFARPEFKTVEEMDDAMITRWNERVRPNDKVYHLGDIAMGRRHVERVMPQLHGKKRLIRGNHDNEFSVFYMAFFEEIHSTRSLNGLLLTHVPAAPWGMGRWRANVHGHCHHAQPLFYKHVSTGLNISLAGQPMNGIEPFAAYYVNVSVENTDYRPLSLEEVSAMVPLEPGDPNAAHFMTTEEVDEATFRAKYKSGSSDQVLRWTKP